MTDVTTVPETSATTKPNASTTPAMETAQQSQNQTNSNDSYLLTNTVTIHENERSWIGKGFGKGGLLPNDRGRYSLSDGSGRWKTAEEAFSDALPIGWKYKHNYPTNDKDNGDDDVNVNATTTTTTTTKKGDWWFARDFATGAVANAKTAKSAFHFVRFRALTRPIVFDPRQYHVAAEPPSKGSSNSSSSPRDGANDSNTGTISFATTCDHCDSKEVRAVSKLLLEVLAYNSLLHAPNSLTEATAFILKNKLVRRLINFQQATTNNNNNNNNGGGGENNGNTATTTDAFYQLQGLSAALHSFSEEERATLPIQSLFSHHFRERRQIAGFDDRCVMLSKMEHFSEAERVAVARILIRKLDPHFQLHCDQVQCGSDCQFEWVQCPNANCTETLSKFYLETHQKQCPYTVIPCESCHESFPRHKQMDHHKFVCPNRQAFCPFGSIGCVKIVAARDIPDHLTNDVGSHLLLAVNRLHEHESVMRNAHKNVQGLETKNVELHKLLAAQKATATAEAKRLATLERTVQQLQRKMSNMESTNRKQSQRIDDLEKMLRPTK